MNMIRPARADESDAIRQLVVSVQKGEGMFDPTWPMGDLDDVVAAYRGSGGEFLVAEVGGQIVGTAAFHPVSDKLAILRRFYVVSGSRGKGIGRELLNRIEGLCKERGNVLMVAISEHGFKRAFGVYIKAGFVPFRTEPENFLVKYLVPGSVRTYSLEKLAKMEWYYQWMEGAWQQQP